MDATLFIVLALVFLAVFAFRLLRGEKVGTIECSMDRQDPAIRLRLTVLRHPPRGLEPESIDLKASVVLALRLYPLSREQALELAGHLEEAARLAGE